jgi:hypothetical protein
MNYELLVNADKKTPNKQIQRTWNKRGVVLALVVAHAADLGR